MKLSRYIRHGKKVAGEAAASVGISAAADRIVFARAAVPARPKDRHVLLAAPGSGNIGDQAMVESYLENTTGPVDIIVRAKVDLVLPAEFDSRVTLVELPALLYKDGRAHFRDVAALRRVLAGAASFTVVGADIMDGKYSVRGSIRRSNAAQLAASLGIDSRILGFSWNGSPQKGALAALVAASKAGVVPLLRDPVSATRARQQGVRNVRDAADVVFAAKTVDTGILDRLGIAPEDREKLVLVNVSGLIGRSLDQVGEYEVIIDHLRAAGCSVILLPHVSRPLADDAIACAAVYERVGSDRVTLVEGLLAPAEVRGLASAAEFVITGRMHLSIMTLWNSKPAITLTTQGKVEGLMEMFESKPLCVEPQAGFSSSVVAVIDELLAEGNGIAERIARLLPRAKELADQNFAGLPLHSEFTKKE